MRSINTDEYFKVKIKTTGQIGYLYSRFDDGTVSVIVDAEESLEKSGVTTVGIYPENHKVFGLEIGDIEMLNE